MSAGAAQAERQPTLDEALAQTLHERAPIVKAPADAKTCRTLTDLSRRSRRATVCMAGADWDVLVRASRPSTTRKPGAVKLSSAGAVRTFAR